MVARFFARGSWFVLALAALPWCGGCDSASPYRVTLRDQTAAMEELGRILSTITDEVSMKAARTELKARFTEFEGITHRAQKLPHPSPEILREVQEDGEKLREALAKVQDQVSRIQALPAGPEFLESFERLKSFRGE